MRFNADNVRVEVCGVKLRTFGRGDTIILYDDPRLERRTKRDQLRMRRAIFRWRRMIFRDKLRGRNRLTTYVIP